MGIGSSKRSSEQITKDKQQQKAETSELQRRIAQAGGISGGTDGSGAVTVYSDPESQMRAMLAQAAISQVSRDSKPLNKRDLARILQVLLQTFRPLDRDATDITVESRNTAD